MSRIWLVTVVVRCSVVLCWRSGLVWWASDRWTVMLVCVGWTGSVNGTDCLLCLLSATWSALTHAVSNVLNHVLARRTTHSSDPHFLALCIAALAAFSPCDVSVPAARYTQQCIVHRAMCSTLLTHDISSSQTPVQRCVVITALLIHFIYC